MKGSRTFRETRMEWVEAGLQVVKQGYNMLNLLLNKRNINFLHLDFNFQIKPKKTLSTKERKRGRLGNSFHLIRELLRLVKFLVDARVAYRLKHISHHQLAKQNHFLFNNIGHITAVY